LVPPVLYLYFLCFGLYILFKSKEIIDLNQKRITYHSKSLDQYETIKQFRLLPHAFTVETGEITPTLKRSGKTLMKNTQK